MAENYDLSSVFPGENCFFYWKTAASLWKTRLEDFRLLGPILVPINWSFHSDNGESYDFAASRPETSLKKLETIAKELNRQIIFLLPISPVPFLPNGGIPHLLARNLVLDQKQMIAAVSDSEGNVNKMYSFFDTRVYQGYSVFVKKLSEYFVSSGIESEIWTMDCGCLENCEFVSFLEDRSRVFEKGFSRYLGMKNELILKDEEGNKIDLDSAEESVFIKAFTKEIYNLYLDTAKNNLSGNWIKNVNVAFLGADRYSLIERALGIENTKRHTADLFNAYANDILPSSVLLSKKEKTEVFQKELQEVVSKVFIPAKFKNDLYEADFRIGQYLSLFLFELLVLDGAFLRKSWSEFGLIDYLDSFYFGLYKVSPLKDFINQSADYDLVRDDRGPKILFVNGASLSQTSFKFMIKFFMHGGSLIISKNGMKPDLLRKLELFFLENSIKIEKINLNANVENASLGDGRIVLFDADSLKHLDQKKQLSFWHTLINTFEIRHISITKQEGIDLFWSCRTAGNNELKFEEVRRLCVFNKTSYKKQLKIPIGKNFVIIKMVDEKNVSHKTYPSELELNLLPGGSISVDFGMFS